MGGAHEGEGVAKTCHEELAELYEERLRAKGLTVSIEPVWMAVIVWFLFGRRVGSANR